VACGGVIICCEVVVQCVLGCGCVGFGVGVWVRVEGVLPWGRRDVVRGVARVFFLKVSLSYVNESRWVCCDFVGVWVPYGLKFGLIFVAGL
jgi:hypothetical protein